MTTNSITYTCSSDYEQNEDITPDLPYFRLLPSGINIFQNVYPLYSQLDKELAKNTQSFITCFLEILTALNNQNAISNNLPQLVFTPFDDNTLLIEWIFKDFRIGFSIDKNPQESNWYLTTNEKFKELTLTETMDALHPEEPLKRLISFALQNS